MEKSESQCDETELAVEIETCLFEKYKDMSEYRSRFYDIHFNLGQNKRLAFQLLSQNISAEQICDMTNEQLAREELSSLRQKNKEWNSQAARSDIHKSQSMTDLYRVFHTLFFFIFLEFICQTMRQFFFFFNNNLCQNQKQIKPFRYKITFLKVKTYFKDFCSKKNVIKLFLGGVHLPKQSQGKYTSFGDNYQQQSYFTKKKH
ncbi:RNA polymerase II elongation factor [Reticulomyxa filosa]|uniref:RNA polymerase II elongation factor n=1 Tax=Reticulomyxa filosa TaxID=46433 RepID=X6M9N6_RETFI|nr:RNA polymerase II elongation factor [Reticulomyxa filosa]|eukprot:ETO10718.1 RNA polymerase II elongation factor [Reticulomyxa filosa]